MSFSIKLQNNSSEKNRLTKAITDVVTLTGTLKDGTSLVNPVLLISGTLNTIVGCNYLTIPSFNRSYFITDIVSVRSGLVEVTAHVDVLSSFATEIRANTAIIRRQELRYNLYLNDGQFKVYQNPNVVTQSFPNGFSGQELVLAVAGG